MSRRQAGVIRVRRWSAAFRLARPIWMIEGHARIIAVERRCAVSHLTDLGSQYQRYMERVEAQSQVCQETPETPEQGPVGCGSATDIQLNLETECFEIRCFILECYGFV